VALWEGGRSFVALDFETTGLSERDDRIVEYGALRFDKTGPLEEFSLLVDPLMPISPEAAAVSGIDDALVRGLTPWRRALPDFLAFLSDQPLVAHNAPFDLSFLNRACELEGLKKPDNPVFDTRPLAKEAFPGHGSYSLQALAAVLGLDPGEAHRALDDAYTCMRLFERCVRRLGRSE
jgi:DNA polymerase III epsilon subunit family exonuclease